MIDATDTTDRDGFDLPDGRIAVTGEWHCAALGETTVTIPAAVFQAAAKAWFEGAPHPRTSGSTP